MDGFFDCYLRCDSSSPVLSCSKISFTHCNVKQCAYLCVRTRQTALERQDLSCTYLAHHELESIIMIMMVIIIIITITITIVIIGIVIVIIIIIIMIIIVIIIIIIIMHSHASCSVVQNPCLSSGSINMQQSIHCSACRRSGRPLTASVQLLREDHSGHVDGCVWLTTPRGSIDSAFNMLPQVTVAHAKLASLLSLHPFSGGA